MPRSRIYDVGLTAVLSRAEHARSRKKFPQIELLEHLRSLRADREGLRKEKVDLRKEKSQLREHELLLLRQREGLPVTHRVGECLPKRVRVINISKLTVVVSTYVVTVDFQHETQYRCYHHTLRLSAPRDA